MRAAEIFRVCAAERFPMLEFVEGVGQGAGMFAGPCENRAARQNQTQWQNELISSHDRRKRGAGGIYGQGGSGGAVVPDGDGGRNHRA